MPLTGHLSDLSLSELIEFFCNQRKTGQLKRSMFMAKRNGARPSATKRGDRPHIPHTPAT